MTDPAFLAATASLLRLEGTLRQELGDRFEAAAHPLAMLRGAIAFEAYQRLEAALQAELGDKADAIAAPMAAIRAALTSPSGEPSAPAEAGGINAAQVFNDLEDIMEALMIQRRG